MRPFAFDPARRRPFPLSPAARWLEDGYRYCPTCRALIGDRNTTRRCVKCQ